MSRRWWFALLGLTLFSFLIRTCQRDAESPWFDKASSACKLALPFEQVVQDISVENVPHTLLLGAFPELVGSEFSLHYPSMLFWALVVAAMCAIRWRLIHQDLFDRGVKVHLYVYDQER